MSGRPSGHHQVQTTVRTTAHYAYLADDPVKTAADRIANRIAVVVG